MSGFGAKLVLAAAVMLPLQSAVDGESFGKIVC